MAQFLASFLYSGLSSAPAPCLPSFHAAPLSCSLRASCSKMLQIPQMESLIPLARSWRKVLTLSAISSPPKLPTTQKREKRLKNLIIKDPAPHPPQAHAVPLGPSVTSRIAHAQAAPGELGWGALGKNNSFHKNCNYVNTSMFIIVIPK